MGVLFTMGLFTSWEVPGCLQPMDTLQQLAVIYQEYQDYLLFLPSTQQIRSRGKM